MDDIDKLKILIAVLSAEASRIFINATTSKKNPEEEENDLTSRSIVLLIRTIILINSINKKWPLAMCASISVIISIAVIFLRTSLDKETNVNNKTDTDKEINMDKKKKDKVIS